MQKFLFTNSEILTNLTILNQIQTNEEIQILIIISAVRLLFWVLEKSLVYFFEKLKRRLK